jgi:hypothetical protein
MIRFHRVIKVIARFLFSVLAVAGLALAAPATAQGDLLIAPTRLILDGRGTGQIILSNIGDKEATYRVTAELRRMTAQGGLEEVDAEQANAIEKAALEMVRFAPRRVTLPPGQPQSIRISARPSADLPDGEYRIHLSFNALPEVAPLTAQQNGEQIEGLRIQLIPIYGITIPIIVRKGGIDASAAISNPRIEQQDGERFFFGLDMARSGDASVFGEILIWQPGQSDPVYQARGIAIYPEIQNRALTLPISPEQAATLRSGGRLRFEYRELPENGGGLIAEFEGAIG